MTWFDERLYPGGAVGYTQRFEVTRVVCERRSKFHELTIFETPVFGRVLTLDGIVQTTERDEFAYHEMLAHVPLFAHGDAKRVLIVGGGDGGVLREVLRHASVEAATLVDIDRLVVDVCREHMPSLSDGAFDDSRSHLVIADATRFVAQTTDRFDVVIVDSTDPLGPGEALFTEAFYADCKRVVEPEGILVTQNGVPFLQAVELASSMRKLKTLFGDVTAYLAVVPSYVGGFMALGWASDNANLRRQPETAIADRFVHSGIETRYYGPAIHVAAFSLPRYIERLTA